MRRYVALLRGVSPLNAKMSDLRRAFGSAGFADVRTILSSGKERLENTPVQEKATALVEIAKIANLRLQDLVEAPVVEAATS